MPVQNHIRNITSRNQDISLKVRYGAVDGSPTPGGRHLHPLRGVSTYLFIKISYFVVSLFLMKAMLAKMKFLSLVAFLIKLKPKSINLRVKFKKNILVDK